MAGDEVMSLSTTEHEGGCTVVAVAGDVDLRTSPRLREALLMVLRDARGLIVDLGEVDYIDSSGITSLIEALKLARDKRVYFALAAVSEGARRVLHLARLDQIFVLRDSVDAALHDAALHGTAASGSAPR